MSDYQQVQRGQQQNQGQGSQVSMKQLLECGVHFGHQSRRWNPKMKTYIYTERNGIYIVDLKKTLKMLREACAYVRDAVSEGKEVLFVGTKKQAKESIQGAALNCGMHWVNNRWLGGMLTNFKTLRKSVEKLLDFDRQIADGTMAQYSKKEQSRRLKHRAALEKNLAGMKNMTRLPDIVFIVDPHKERIAVHEAKVLGIPIVAITDTNCDPDPIDWVVPGNDDAIRAIKLISEKISESAREGQMIRAEAASGYGVPADTAEEQAPATPAAAAPTPADQAQSAVDLQAAQQAAQEARQSGEVVDLSARYAQFQQAAPEATPAPAPEAPAPEAPAATDEDPTPAQ